MTKHVTGRYAMGGAKLASGVHFGGAKALFSYVNLQVSDSVGGAKPCKIFRFGGIAPRASLQVRACTKDVILLPYHL